MKLITINGRKFLFDAEAHCWEADYQQDPNGKPGELITRWNPTNRIDSIPREVIDDLGEEQTSTAPNIPVYYCYLTPDGRRGDYSDENKYILLATTLTNTQGGQYRIGELIDTDGEARLISGLYITPEDPRSRREWTHDEVSEMFRTAFSYEMNDRLGDLWTDTDTARAADTIWRCTHRF